MEHKSPRRLEDRIVAAIETGTKLRGSLENSEQTDPVERLVGMIESEAARIAKLREIGTGRRSAGQVERCRRAAPPTDQRLF